MFLRIVSKYTLHRRNLNSFLMRPVAMTAADDDSGAMLPATAGALPLFGLFGGLALFGASLIRVFRRA